MHFASAKRGNSYIQCNEARRSIGTQQVVKSTIDHTLDLESVTICLLLESGVDVSIKKRHIGLAMSNKTQAI